MFNVTPGGDNISGWGWPLGVDVLVAADDPATPGAPDVTVTLRAFDRPGLPEGFINGSLPGVAPGWFVTVFDGVVTKTHTVRDISITGIDPATDVVSGTAAASTSVWVSADGSARVNATADSGGTWTASLNGVYDIKPGWSVAVATQEDEDFDFTSVGRTAEVSVSCFGPFVRATAGSSGTWVADLSGVCDIQLGWSEVSAAQVDEDFDATNISQLAGTIAIPPGTSLTTPGHGTATSGVPTVWMSDPLTVETHGCGSGTATATLTGLEDAGYVQSIMMTEVPLTSGTYTGTFAPASYHGLASVTIAVTGCSPPATVEFTIYIDPSGVVRDTFGRPVVGATVTLYRADAPDVSFVAVPGGSSVMSPGNRMNPDLTGPDGRFGWDVIAGFYKVRAEKTGCTAPGGGAYAETGVLTIPPPVTDLELVLTCPATPADLVALVESMQLDKGLANDLTHKARDAANRIAAGKDACKPLDEFARRVVDEAGKEKPKLTSPQARELLDAVHTVELTSGCLLPGSTLPAAELAVVDLIDVINGLGLHRGLENDLRNKASEAGKQAATGTGHPCKQLDELLRAGTKHLTPVQLAALTAAVNDVQGKLLC